MAEKVGSIYFDLDLDDAKYDKKLDAADGKAKSFSQTLKEGSLQLAALGATAAVALGTVIMHLNKAVDAAVANQNALMGLSSVAKGTGNDMNAATRAAQNLSADGLMSVTDSATGLKNLLASGFSLPEAIRLMQAFKDSAAFGRQGSLEFGQAVRTATEGIKNGNSILVDNAGVTKNLSVILKEQGKSVNDVMNVTSDASVRQALYNGILNETRHQLGDAEKLARSFGGAQAAMNTQIQYANIALGEALQPILTKIFNVLSPLITKFTDFVKNNKELVAALAAVVTIGLGLVAVLGIVGAVVGAIMTLGTVGLVAAAVAAAVALISGALIFLETKFGLVSKAVEFMKQAISNFATAAVGFFNSIVNSAPVQWFINFMGTTFAKIWEDLQGIFSQLANSLKPLWDALGKVFGAIGDFISKHSAVFLNILKVIGIAVGAIVLAPLAIAIGAVVAGIKILSVVLGFVNKHFETIKKVVLTILKVVFAPLIIAIAAIVLAFKAIVWVVQTLWQVFTFVFNAIWAVVSFVFNAIMLLWNTILSPVFNAIIYILQSLFSIWWSIFSGILSIVTTIISTIAQIIFVILKAVFTYIYNGFLKPIGMFFAQVFGAIWNVISTILNLIWGGIKWYFTTVFNFVKSIFNAIVGFVSWAWNGIKNAIINPVAAAVSAVWNKIVGIKNAVVSGVNSAWNWIKDQFNRFVNVGKDLIDGLVKGVGNAKDAVVNKVKEICSGALDAVKNFFGIKSPSRVMAQMGDFLMQGFSNGMDKAGSAVVNTAETIAQRVTDGVNHSINQVQKGASKIGGIYNGMQANINAISAAGVAPLNTSVAAMINAGNANDASGGAIAQAPVVVQPNFSGIVARSRSEWRDIVADGIAAVNEDLQARNLPQIADGKVNGSTNGQ